MSKYNLIIYVNWYILSIFSSVGGKLIKVMQLSHRLLSDFMITVRDQVGHYNDAITL